MSKAKTDKKKKVAAPAAKPKAAPKKGKPSGNGKQPRETKAPVQASVAATPPTPAKESKLALVITLLSRPEGAAIDDIVAVTGWQKHTVRAAISHALAKKRGYKIVSDKPQGGQRTYRIVEPE